VGRSFVILCPMADEALYTARSAARKLGRPTIERTLVRRAERAAEATPPDPALQRLGNYWAAPLDWWSKQAADIPRKPGPKRQHEP
jgi:hypothetical protein